MSEQRATSGRPPIVEPAPRPPVRPRVSGTSIPELKRRVDADGYVVLRQVVAPEATEAALRRLNLEIRRRGVSPEEIEEWQLGTFFPHLRWEPEIWGVLPPQAAELLGWQEGDDWADPQLLLRFPDEEQPWPLEPHVDELPPWAAPGRVYRGIVGVALTPACAKDGAPVVWPGSHLRDTTSGDAPTALTLAPGDALVMHPQLGHSGSLNLGPSIRTTIYFRLLTDAA